MFIDVLNVQENVLDIFVPFLHPSYFSGIQLMANNIFHKCDMLYLIIVIRQIDHFYRVLHNEKSKKLNGVM